MWPNLRDHSEKGSQDLEFIAFVSEIFLLSLGTNLPVGPKLATVAYFERVRDREREREKRE